MNRLAKIIIAVSLCLPSLASYAQNVTNKGTEFWVGYGHHQYMEPSCNGATAAPNDMNMVLYLSAEEPATVTITIDSSGIIPALWWRRTYNIPANTVISIDNALTPAVSFSPATAGAFGPMPKGTVNAAVSGSDPNFDARLITDPPPAGTGGEGIFRKKGIHIQSNVPIVAYAHIYGGVSSGATMLMPVTTWGYTYTSMNSEQRDADRSYSWMYIIAKENNTRVQITPSALTRLGKPAGVPFTVDLQKGQIYQLIGSADCATGNGPELTGTTVKSLAGADGQCHTIAVFSGSSRTGGETLTCGTGSGRDNDMQQLFPEHAWGKRYLTAPFSKATTTVLQPNQFQTSVFKVLVKDPTTVVTRNGTPLTGLINGKYYKYSSSTTDYIEADKPVMVGQFMSGTTTCNSTGQGDPEMIYLSPIEQAIKKTGFFRNTKQLINTNYLTLIVPTAGVPSLRIDNSTTFSFTYPHSRPGYTVVVKGWLSAQAQCLVTCDSAFNAITYGLGSAESYGFNAGTNINNLNAISSVHNQLDPTVPSHPFTCVNSPVELSVLMAYQPTQVVWQLSALAGNLNPSADVTVNAPVPVGTVIVDGISYYKYTLPGTYTFNTVGTFTVSIFATSPTVENCNNTEELKISYIVKDSPVPDFTFTHTGCTLDTVYLSGQNLAGGGFSLGQWNWTFPPAAITATGQNIRQVLPPGTYGIKLTGISSEGCVGDITKTITVHPKPTATLDVNPLTVCLGQPVTLSETSSYAGTTPGISTWYWNLDNGTVFNNPNANNVVFTYPDPGTYNVKHVVKVSDLCISDTLVKTVVISPEAKISFTYPPGCLPVTGIAQFTAAATDLGGVPVISYNWNFGDPNATAGNPNTSTAQNPSHTYTVFGTYPVTLTITTNSGCSGDSTVNLTFSTQPALAYAAIPSICETSAPVSVANATVTNSTTGTGVYSGPGTTAAGMFDPAIAGPGTHTITYTFTSDGGCIETVTQTILVYAKPHAAFTLPAAGCLAANGQVVFTNTSTISDGQAMTWLWTFNDPSANAGNPNTSTAQNPTHNFAEGTYAINLQVTTVNSCIKDTTINAVFSVTPALAYPALTAICQNAAPVSVATASTTNVVTGTGVYSGPGTNAAGIFDPAAAGAGTHTITYTYTTTGGCTATITQTILVYAKPHADFIYTNTACLPVTGLVQFTNASTIADAQTMTYAWNFNDANANAGNPNTSVLLNPTHNFGEGNYAIHLTVTSSNGCVKDTTINAVFSVTPSLAYPALTAVCQNAAPFSIATASVLNGVAGTGVYSGAGTNAAGLFNPALAGPGTHTITFTFTSAGGCTQSITRDILVYARPRANFTFPAGGCLPPNAQILFNNTSTIADAQTMTWLWTFNDPNANAGNQNTSTAQNPTHNFGEGTYNITLVATSSNGCIKDTTITATFNLMPTLAYPALAAICESAAPVSVATASATNAVTGSGVYSGPGTSAAGLFNPALAGPGTHTITYTYTTTGGCTQTITQTILVYARPKANFTFPVGVCLPANGQVQFNNTSTIADAQTMTWLWTFNDPNANAGNPNTSTAQNPAHNYAEGTYSINLAVTSSNSCVKDTTITATFKVTPVLAYTALTGVCESASPLSVAGGSVTNGVTGTGVYSGPGTNTAGMFDPAAAGAGIHTITYTFTSTGGCTQNITRTIEVYPRPLASFTINPDICLNQTATISSTSTIPSGTITSWSWDLGNASTPTYTNGNPFTVSYASATTFTVKLINTSNRGCVSLPVTHTIAVHPLPVVDFVLPADICMPGGIAVFANLTSVADNSALGYQWDFGDVSPVSNASSPSHTYAAAGNYNVTLTATSAFGCSGQKTKQVVDFYDKPIAAFTVTPDELCQGAATIFSDGSSAPNSTILSWKWNFGDNTTSTAANPIKTFTAPGTFDVKLQVTNGVGCISDPVTRRVTVHLQPVIDAGQSFVVAEGSTVQFTATANSSGLVFNWSPPVGLSNPGGLTPTLVAVNDQTYTLTATGDFGCTATDFITVKILKAVKPPNVFSPNGDGIHDKWLIPNLADYPDCRVSIFNRYGQEVFYAVGYNTPFDGTMKGKDLPVGAYYYVIELKNGFKPITGSITIVR